MTNTINKNYRIVYKMNYAMELIQKGHNVVATMPNPKKQNLICWIFENNETFDKDLESLVERSKNNG